MKKYVIAVGSPEISEQVQKALFSAGFGWLSCGCNIRHLGVSFITLNYCYKGGMTTTPYTCEVNKDIRAGIRTLITSQDVIADPFRLDGATKPAKESDNEFELTINKSGVDSLNISGENITVRGQPNGSVEIINNGIGMVTIWNNRSESL